MTRPNGFYWVRWSPDGISFDPVTEIAAWTNPWTTNELPDSEDGWTFCGSEIPVQDGDHIKVLSGPILP